MNNLLVGEKMKIIIVTIKSWNIKNAQKLKEQYKSEHDIKIITEREELNEKRVGTFYPDFIFFPHWSDMIPASIYEKYECVVFHMTDLPFGRGGSPLQNLIVRGFEETKISAIKVQKEIDAGPIYMKESVSLEGSASDIFKRVSDIIFQKMIPQFLKERIEPIEQQGKPTFFRRRKPEESELMPSMKMSEIYDYIRMLDAEGYPNAFMKFGGFKLSFRNAKMNNGKLLAEVIMEEEK